MPDYILAYHGGRKPDSPEEGARLMAKWQAWVSGMGNAMVNPGTPLGQSKTVSASGVSDGGGANPLMGFSILKADDLDAALTMVRECPHLEIGTIELAEMMEMKQK